MEKSTKKVKKLAKKAPAKEAVKKAAPKATPTTKKTPVAKKAVAPKAPKKGLAPAVEKQKIKPVATPIETIAPAPSKKEIAITPKALHEPAKPVHQVKPVINLMHGVGRRKSAIARVWLQRGKGQLIINDHNHIEYFDTDATRLSASHPFRVINQAQNYDAIAKVHGGGLSAQADAVKVGLARALVQVNSEWRSALRQAGLLTVDARRKERKKYGRRAARRRFQFVKR